MFLILLCLHGFAQEQKVTGTVKDKTGSPLPGVTITDKDLKTSGTVTDVNGNFSLIVKGNSKIIVFSFIGYDNQEVSVAGRTSVNVVMEINSKMLGDVVVIGYQEVSRRKNTAAIATVKGDAIANLPAPSVDMMLQGRVSGVNVQNFSGEPGIRNSVVIRGNSSVLRGYDEARALSAPLYVIDGIPTSVTEFGGIDASGTGTNAIAGINPNDIESIDILKDASAAAIYGSRGSNGIIIIKTRKAKTGKPEFNFSTYVGITQKPKLIEVVAGAEERRMKMDVLNLYNGFADNQTLPMMLTDSLNPDFNNATDWQSYFYQTGMINNYDLSMAGATDAINYRLSLGHYKEDGVVKNTGFKRYSILASINAKVTPWLNSSSRFRVTRTDRPRSINERTGSFFAFDTYSLPSSFFSLTESSREYLLGNDNRQDKNINNNLQFSNAFNVDLAKGLLFNTTVNYENRNSSRNYFQPSVVRDNGYGYASSYTDKVEIASLFSTLEYTTKFGNHHLNMIGGTNMEYTKWNWNFGSADLIPNDNAWAVNVANKQFSNTSSATEETGLQSIFLRLNYDFKDRYLLSAVLNRDASSKFGKDNRWGTFPSISLGWIVSDEPALQNSLGFMNFLKLRGSWGITGNQPERNYLGYNNYTVNQAGFADNGEVTSYNGTSVITPNYYSGIAQKDLSWEESKQGNLGLEAGFFKDRIRLIVDLYKRELTKGFFDFLLPNASGYTLAQTNAIGLRNSGVEVTINTRNLNPKSALQWNTDITFSYNQNVITALPNGGRSIIFNYNTGVYGSDYLLSVGLPVNQFYVFEFKGIYSRPEDVPYNLLTGQPMKNFVGWDYHAGDPILVDQDGNFDLKEPMDQIVGGDPNPKFYGGILNNLTYKGFSLGIFLSYTLGRDILNSYENRRLEYLFEATGDGGERNLASRAIMDINKLNFWKKSGDIADLPTFSLVDGTRSPYRFLDKSTMYIEKGDYLRIKYITAGYSFSQQLLSKLKVKRLRLYGVIDNLYTFQKSTIPDAEGVNAYGIYTGDGYPIPKKFTIGLDFGF